MSPPSTLSYEVLVTDGVTRASDIRLPNGDRIVSSPITSILIFGETDAVLIDPPMTREQTQKVSDWIAQSGKHLKYIYVTHRHGDHWFGTEQILEGGNGGLQAWIKAIDQVEALKPRIVIAGHKQKNRADDPVILEQTRQYLLDAIELLAEKPTPREFFDKMIELHPDRINQGPLWYSAIGLLGAPTASPGDAPQPKN
ncbi:MBL fold metallo-hydrolase [Pseudomonas sp. H11T01]|uniref:MBL fold metallo-hydrolase n=1 Tax=Pseudomonas sp. H11T01 TaxID=3402749 RepID=UPI003ACAE9FE